MMVFLYLAIVVVLTVSMGVILEYSILWKHTEDTPRAGVLPIFIHQSL